MLMYDIKFLGSEESDRNNIRYESVKIVIYNGVVISTANDIKRLQEIDMLIEDSVM